MAKYKENLQKQETKKQFIPNNAHKKSKKRLKSSQVIVLILMIFWTLMSVLTAFLGIDRCNSKFNEVKADAVIQDNSFTLNLAPLELSVLAHYEFTPVNDNQVYFFDSDVVETIYNFTIRFVNGLFYSIDYSFYDLLLGNVNYHLDLSNSVNFIDVNKINANILGANFTDLRTLYYYYDRGGNLSSFDFRNGMNFKYSMSDPTLVDFSEGMIFFRLPNVLTNSNFYKVRFFSNNENDYDIPIFTNNPKFHYIRFYNTNDEYFEIVYATLNGRVNDYDYYRFTTSNVDLTNNEYYNLGYTTGYNESKYEVQREAYQDGYNNGLIDGEAQGFENGVQSSNNYTFLSLFGAVIDAPLQALTGLFNFDLLGFNLLGLFQALITLCVIIFVVKLFV